MKKEHVIKVFADNGFHVKGNPMDSMANIGYVTIKRKNGAPVQISFLSYTMGIVARDSELISIAYSMIKSIDFNGKSFRILFNKFSGVSTDGRDGVVECSLEIFVQDKQ